MDSTLLQHRAVCAATARLLFTVHIRFLFAKIIFVPVFVLVHKSNAMLITRRRRAGSLNSFAAQKNKLR